MGRAEMEKETAPAPSLWLDGVAEYTKAAQEKGVDPAAWAMHVSLALASAGAPLPSPELSELLVSRLCWENYHVPLAWKYADSALSANLASPILLLAMLSSRVIASRHLKPVAYRLYMELLRRHGFSFAVQIKAPSFKRVMVSVDNFLHLSQAFGIQASEPGLLIVEFVFLAVWQLLDATVADEGLQELVHEKKSKWEDRPQYMEVDCEGNFDDKTLGYSEKLQKTNSVIAIELIAYFLEHKLTSKLLYLAHENLPCQWGVFASCLQLLLESSSAVRNSAVPREALVQLVSNKGNALNLNSNKDGGLYSTLSSGLLMSPAGLCHGVNSALWIPIDLYLEDCIDGSVAATSAIELLSGLVKALKAINGSTWHDAFLGLWMASLRLVQRERDPHEGPVPRLDSRLCILLSITTLSIANIIEEEEVNLVNDPKYTNQLKEKAVGGERRKDLTACLQILGVYESLLVPPVSVVSAANQAAAKAIMFMSGLTGSEYLDNTVMIDKTISCAGNLRHLIVEACISRKLLDTSAYFWPGYVRGCINQMPHTLHGQVPGWSTYMKGASLTSSMVNALAAAPASSLPEIEKTFEIAVNGSEDDRISAATILCGATLIRGWNIQEHTVHFVVNLLSPPNPVEYSGKESHLISHGPVLNVVLTGISSVDCVQVFSYHGLVPELAGALMAICEVFGSCIPSITWKHPTGEEVSAHTVFSNAFILLLRLWKFNHPPLEYCIMGDGAPVGSQLTPEYLLLLRNSHILSCDEMKTGNNHGRIFVDDFPKLKIWYRQHQACLASTLSGLVHGTPVHQNVDSLLTMMFKKINRSSAQSVGSATSGSSGLSSSSGPGIDDCSLRPNLPAWEIMEAVPFVVDAALTACSHGRLSPRELATGLKDLADFLPASLATIVSYFSAEVSRGVWKPAFMNGTDWPSPAANLSTVEEQIKKIVADTGVHVPSLVAGGSSPATLPLPLAAFVSLTITYKLDKASERFLNLAGPALENLAASCPWPSMPIVAALWTQKVKRWSDFLIFSASRTVFHHNHDAVVQLLRSCFSATLGLSDTPLSILGGVGNLLGHGFGSHFCGGLSPVAPGILYLGIYRCINDTVRLTEEIISLLMDSVKEMAEKVLPRAGVKATKYGMKYGQVSLASALTQVKVAAALGATFVWLSGGTGLVQALVQEIMPSWFLSVHELDQECKGGSLQDGVLHALLGHALAHFLMFCGLFAWGVDSTPVSKRRSRTIKVHMAFLASAFDGKISLGCEWATWHAYASCLLELMVSCAPSWVAEVDLEVLKRLSMGLKQWNQEELALALLCKGGVKALGVAAETLLDYERTI